MDRETPNPEHENLNANAYRVGQTVREGAVSLTCWTS